MILFYNNILTYYFTILISDYSFSEFCILLNIEGNNVFNNASFIPFELDLN